MKPYLLIFLSSMLFLGGCESNPEENNPESTTPQTESKTEMQTNQPNDTNSLTTETMPTNEITELKIETLSEGTGPAVKKGDQVAVHYVGTFPNGDMFDSSRERGQPFDLIVGAGQVIKGWDQGLVGMKTGETRKLTIPSDLAYGDGGMPGIIPPKATLVFEVELMEIQ